MKCRLRTGRTKSHSISTRNNIADLSSQFFVKIGLKRMNISQFTGFTQCLVNRGMSVTKKSRTVRATHERRLYPRSRSTASDRKPGGRILEGDSPRPTSGRCPAARKPTQSPSCFSAAPNGAFAPITTAAGRLEPIREPGEGRHAERSISSPSVPARSFAALRMTSTGPKSSGIEFLVLTYLGARSRIVSWQGPRVAYGILEG